MAFFVLSVIDRIFAILYILILARVVLSFIQVPLNRFTRPIVSFIFEITEPILSAFRNLLPMVRLGSTGLDLSPLIAILVLRILHYLIREVVRFFVF